MATTQPRQHTHGPIDAHDDRAGWTSSTELTVTAWCDPNVEAMPGAIATNSDDALVWWCSTVGSISMVVAHRLALYAAAGPSVWTVADLGLTFGISTDPRRLLRCLDRLERFGVARLRGRTIEVRLMLPPLSYGQRRRLPAYLRDAYEARPHDLAKR